MKQMIKQVPIPVAGVMLGLCALGNLIQGYSETARMICGAAAAFLGVFLLLKFLIHPGQIREDYENPILASVSATIFMAVMQLCTYLHPYAGRLSTILWFAAVFGHILLMVWYTKKFLLRFDLSEIFPTCYITYVGIVVATVTSPTFGMESLGRILLVFGMIAYGVMFIVITYRYMKIEVHEAAKPLFCIYTAPMSLCLSGYLIVTDEKSWMLTLILEILAQIMFILVLVKLPGLLRLPFYPSYAAFTFPFVITAFALQKWLGSFAEIGVSLSPTLLDALNILLIVETAIAVLMVSYTFLRFIVYLGGTLRKSLAVSDANASY